MRRDRWFGGIRRREGRVGIARRHERANERTRRRVELQDFSADGQVNILVGDQQRVVHENYSAGSGDLIDLGVDARMNERAEIFSRAGVNGLDGVILIVADQ